MQTRGLFIVFEGPDGCGKTTQSKKLVEKLPNAHWTSFPNRSTEIGKVIDKYLKKEIELTDKALLLLFSANRWECIENIKKMLDQGITVVCDRYVCSGIAYALSKLDTTPTIKDVKNCINPDIGLLKPDITFYINASIEACISSLSKDNKVERYENKSMLERVIELYPQVSDKCDIPFTYLIYDSIVVMSNVIHSIVSDHSPKSYSYIEMPIPVSTLAQEIINSKSLVQY